MKLRIFLMAILLGGLLPLAGLGEAENRPATGTAMITDMAGRTVSVPSEIKTIMGKSPMGTILVYTLEPDKLAGWNYSLTEGEKAFIPAPYDTLPVLGGWFGKKSTAVPEEIVRISPDIIIDADFLTGDKIKADDLLQEQLGIPIVMVDGSGMDALPDVYRFLGTLLGKGESAGEMADYCSRILDEASRVTASLPLENRVPVYYAEGADGLQTEPRGSVHTQLIPLCGGLNVVAGRNGEEVQNINMALVSLEQILLWNPRVILTPAEGGGNDTFLSRAEELPGWNDVEAIREGRVYPIPQYPFGWFDRPPSVNRIVGVGWLSRLLHPDLFQSSIEEEVRAFYRLFYHLDLSGEEMAALLGK